MKFADANQIPIDTATRTGNPAYQHSGAVANSPGVRDRGGESRISDSLGSGSEKGRSSRTRSHRFQTHPRMRAPRCNSSLPIYRRPRARERAAHIRSSKNRGGIRKNAQTIQTGTRTVSSGVLDAAGNPITRTQPVTQTIATPVDMRQAKTLTLSMIDRLEQEMPIAQQQSSRGLLALRNIAASDDFGPASVADQNLGALKQLQREAVHPKTQYLANQAVNAVAPAVSAAVAKAGPEALDALNQGRALTKAKYATDATIDPTADLKPGETVQSTRPRRQGPPRSTWYEMSKARRPMPCRRWDGPISRG